MSAGFVACVGGDNTTDGGADATPDNTVADVKADTQQKDAAPDVAPDVNPFASPCMATTTLDAGADVDAAPTLVDGGAVTPIQTFTNGMFGCSGKLGYPNRAALCNATENCHVCSAKEWIANAGSTAPTHQYWVDDNLGYAGNGPVGDCFAGTYVDGGSLISVCAPTTDPMRVCLDGPFDAGVDAAYPFLSTDIEGNICNWNGCDYITDDAGLDAAPDGQTKNLHFGGCYGDPTAGALCCCK